LAYAHSTNTPVPAKKCNNFHFGVIDSTMTAAVALAPLSGDMFVPMSIVSCPLKVESSDARKRRREILTLQRATDDGNLSSSSWSSDQSEPFPGGKKQRTVVVSSDDDGSLPSYERSSIARSKGKPKPQMKYDPDVPMTKEEATIWRRDQRRKRNRESAAASRQRQRDRIDELESELNQWKAQFAAIQDKISMLQATAPAPLAEPVVSLCDVPAQCSPTLSSFLHDSGDGGGISRKDLQQPKPNKMISRQA
jgi:Basic region leucine zipper